MSKLIKCKGCEKEVFKDAKSCPNCGKDQRNWFVRNRTNVALLTVSGLAIFTVIDYKKLESEVLSNSYKTSNIVVEHKENKPAELLIEKEVESVVEESPSKSKLPQPKEEEQVVGKPTDKEAEVLGVVKKEELPLEEEKVYSFEEQNAIRNTEELIEKQPYSYQNLIKQLVIEEFPKEVAVLAVESLDVDWKEQTLLFAQKSLLDKGYSKKGMINLLTTEGFSIENIDSVLKELGY